MITKFIHSKIPNAAQWGDLSWDNKVKQENTTLTAASSIAEEDPEVSFYFHTNNGMSLSTGANRKVLRRGDNVFFKGDFWLGSAPGYADTYLLAEVYDTSDSDTAASVLEQIRKVKINGGFDTANGTTKKPVKVNVGIVFCQFKNVTGGDVASCKTAILGKGNELTSFVSRESNKTVSMTVDTYTGTGTTAGWFPLKKDYSDYVNKAGEIATEVDAAIEFPDDWDIVLFAFPKNCPSERLVISHCSNGQSVDVNQKINRIFLDPGIYKEKRPEYVTIHEVTHALGLADYYYNGTSRSYGWSLMSDCRTGWHLTGFDKLLLGWHSVDDYIFLKRGIVKADIFAQTEAGKKGIIVLPDETVGRTDCYFMEIAQPIGRSAANRDAFNDYGLLLMMARPDKTCGVINPFVNKRSTNSDDFGGASKAPFKQTDIFNVNGVFCHSISAYDSKKKNLTAIIGVNKAYKPAAKIQSLRENQKISNNGIDFELNVNGVLTLDGVPVYPGTEPNNLMNTDYGYCAYVDRGGKFNLAKSVNSTPRSEAVLKTFPVPSGVHLPTGSDISYFFTTKVNRVGEKCLSIYQGKPTDPSPIFKYNAITQPYEYMKAGWGDSDHGYRITIQRDGNLCIYQGTTYKWGTKPSFDASTVTFDKDGTMHCYNHCGLKTKTISGKKGTGPFKFGVNSSGGVTSLFVKDINNNKLYDVK